MPKNLYKLIIIKKTVPLLYVVCYLIRDEQTVALFKPFIQEGKLIRTSYYEKQRIVYKSSEEWKDLIERYFSGLPDTECFLVKKYAKICIPDYIKSQI